MSRHLFLPSVSAVFYASVSCMCSVFSDDSIFSYKYTYVKLQYWSFPHSLFCLNKLCSSHCFKSYLYKPSRVASPPWNLLMLTGIKYAILISISNCFFFILSDILGYTTKLCLPNNSPASVNKMKQGIQTLMKLSNFCDIIYSRYKAYPSLEQLWFLSVLKY